MVFKFVTLNLYIKFGKRDICKYICDKLRESNFDDVNDVMISKILENNKNNITINDMIYCTRKNKSYIGYNNVTYDINNDKIVNDPQNVIVSILQYEYNIDDNNVNIYNDVETNDLYNYLMMSIYELFRYNKKKYFYKIETDKSENIDLMNKIFGKYIKFLKIGEKIRGYDRVIVYGDGISEFELLDYIMVPIYKLKLIDGTKEQQIFNQIFGKYRCMYEENKYEIPEDIGIIINPILENQKNKKVGRKKKYFTEEERESARQKYDHAWKQKEESKNKMKIYQKKYCTKNKINNAIDLVSKQNGIDIVDLKGSNMIKNLKK